MMKGTVIQSLDSPRDEDRRSKEVTVSASAIQNSVFTSILGQWALS